MVVKFQKMVIVIIANMADLRQMEEFGHRIWGVLNRSQSEVVECYLSSNRDGADHVLLADLGDFLAVECWNLLDGDPALDDPYHTTTIRRWRTLKGRGFLCSFINS